ncbi:oxidoreductase [Candidatus Marinamargulisbacteria bacterium SCGC AG-333-B06]|nr:oxidoreductase [Candidatus Marinamargulisbacteria bacterium SCGC AG-333-B06]
MLKKIRIAVIGLGNMGKHHVRNYSELEDAQLVAVCDLQENVTKEFAEKYNCKGYTDLTKMLENETIDAVSITVPTALHYPIAYEIISRNIHTLIEKPICDTVEKAETLLTLAKTNNTIVMIGHIERFNPAVQKLKDIIDKGELGKVTSLISRRVGAFPAQIKDANVIIDLAVHDIDIFSYLLNKQPDNIYGNAGSALINGREDYAEIMLTYGDQNGMMQVNWITPIRIRKLSITGTKGYAELNYMTQELTLYESNYHEDHDDFGDFIIKFGNPTEHKITIDKKEPLREELSHFLSCIKTKKQPLIHAKVGIQALTTALTVMDIINIKKPV